MDLSSTRPLATLALLSIASPAAADTVTLEADRDNTLYQSPGGTLSNGAGERLFAGVTATGTLRRTVLRFDLSGLPAGAVIQSVTLDMRITKVPFLPPSSELGLHRLTADWGEGASDAQGEEGAGAPTEPGDASWIHTFFPGLFWANKGGDFVANASATTTATVLGPVSWSSPGMVADVQRWADDPAGNHGWLIKAEDETVLENAKRFNSREFAGDPTTRPRLTVEFDTGLKGIPPVPACDAPVYCDSNPDNVADIAIDNCLCSTGSVSVVMTGAPVGRFGYLLVGSGSTTIVDPPGAQGDLCLGGAAIGRFDRDANLTDGTGSLSIDVLNAVSGGGGGSIPTLGGSLCSPIGQTWNFQFWYRGEGPSRFSKALTVTFR